MEASRSPDHMTCWNDVGDSTSMMSFHSNLTDSCHSAESAKEEEMCALLNSLRSERREEASKILLAAASSPENCIAMRHCGCLPLVVELLHQPDEEADPRVELEVRERASRTLHQIVLSQPDDKRGRREARVLRLLQHIRDYCDQQGESTELGSSVASLMKLSFDEDHRHSMCQLGGLQAIAELLQMDHEGRNNDHCVMIRRYAGMVLTNLTFGDGANKATLCSMGPFMESLVAQLYSPSEDLRQVTASVLRNLSWRADSTSKRALREAGAVGALVRAAMGAEKESTLKSILSALWNLSAHCSANKADICYVEGALAFLVSTLTYRSKSRTLAIVENGGGILRNVSSHIAIQNDYRAILRRHNCLQILLQHLKSPSLTVVSNACGTLWNLSARNAVDQRALWEMGAVGMLKKLINSKHKMISMGSSAALKNLLSAQPSGVGFCVYGENYNTGDDAPSLMVRKQKALNTELDQNLTETYDITDSPKTSPVKQVSSSADKKIRRHVSPSARYMTNQKLKNEFSLPNKGLNNPVVVEEKHNGAFQVTKNAKQALSYKQNQIASQKNIHQNTECMQGNDKHSFSSTQRSESKVVEKAVKAVTESKIPLPKSFIPQRSQSSSPVAQRRTQKPIKQDINITHPKRAWTSNIEKEDSEKPANLNQVGRLFVSRVQQESLDDVGCSLNIKTSTGVRMIKNHPLLVNASNYRTEEGPQKHTDRGRTVEFSVQSDYDIDETLSMMSRSSSMASISSFDQQSLADEESFDLSHGSSDSPCDLSEGETAPSSPVKQQLTNENTHPNPIMGPPTLMSDVIESQEISHGSKRFQMEEKHPKVGYFDVGRVKLKNLDAKDGDVDVFSDNEEKGKEDERKAEKTRLFRIPESPVDRKTSNVIGETLSGDAKAKINPDTESLNLDAKEKRNPDTEPVTLNLDAKTKRNTDTEEFFLNVDAMAKRNPDTEAVTLNVDAKMKRNPDIEAVTLNVDAKMKTNADTEAVTLNVDAKAKRNLDAEAVNSHLSFLMTQNSREVEKVFSPEDEQTENSDNSYFTCCTETLSSGKHRTSESFQTMNDSPRKVSKQKSSDELSEKDIDCSEMDDDTMIRSSILDEAKEIARALMGARVDSTEDMTVSTLSCLSDIDSARPPSVMAEIGCLSMSTASEENLKWAITRECQKLFGAKNVKKTLLRELQMGRLDHSRGSNDSGESLKSSCTSELLGNINPPSVLNDISLTASVDSERQRRRNDPDSMSQRMNEAAAITKLYAKELLQIKKDNKSDDLDMNIGQEITELTIADVADIGSDTEDDLPRDEDEGPMESSMTNDAEKIICFMTAGQLKALQGNADRILHTSDEDEGPMKKRGEMENDVEKNICFMTAEQLIALQKNADRILKQDDLPCDEDDGTMKKSAECDMENDAQKNLCFMTAEQLKALQENADRILNTLRDVEISDEEMGEGNGEMMLDDETMSLVSNESDEELSQHVQSHVTSLPQSRLPSVRKSSLPLFSPRKKPELACESCAFDTRTFTRKKSNIPKEMIPCIPVEERSDSASPKHIPARTDVPSRIVGIWKNRSKSAADVTRGSKLRTATVKDSSKDENRNGWMPPQRLSSESSPTLQTEEVTSGAIRPSSLVLAYHSHAAQRQDSKNNLSPASQQSSNIPKSKAPIRRSFIPTPAKFEN